MGRRSHTAAWIVALTTALASAGAGAQVPIQTVGTHSMIMKDAVVPPIYLGSRKFSFNVRSKYAELGHQVNAPLPGSDGDPTSGGAGGGGGTLEVYNAAGSSEIVTVSLPVGNWQLGGDPAGEFRYVFSAGPPVWKVYVKRHKVSIRGGKEAWGYTLDEPMQGAVAVRLTLGTGITYCSLAMPRTSGAPPSSANYDHPEKFQAAAQQLAPETCPPLP